MRIFVDALQKGEIGLNDKRRAMLSRVPERGDWAGSLREIDPVDLVWLAAKTGDCFAIFKDEEDQILFHGPKDSCICDGLLFELLKEGRLFWVARCDPGGLEPLITIEHRDDWRKMARYVDSRKMDILG